MSALRVAPLARALPRPRDVSVSTFAFLFAELVTYYQGRITNMSDLETKCVECGEWSLLLVLYCVRAWMPRGCVCCGAWLLRVAAARGCGAWLRRMAAAHCCNA